VLRQFSVSVLAATAIALPGAAFAQPAASKPTVAPAVTTTLPAGTAGLVLINTDLNAWGELNRFNPYLNNPPNLPFGTLPNLSTVLGDFDYARDVQSWLGDRVGIALLPLTTPQDTLLNNLVFLVPTTNPEKSNTLLEKAKELAKPTAERTYKGITILEWRPPDSPAPGSETPESPAPEGPAPEGPAPESPAPSSAPSPNPLPNPSPTSGPASPSSSSAVPPRAAWAGMSNGSNTRAFTAEPAIPPAAPIESGGGATAPFPTMSKGLAIAVLPGQFVVATESVALEKMIDAQAEVAAGSANLAQTTGLQRTFAHPQFQKALFASYGDYANILRLFNQTIQLPSDPTKPDSPKQPVFSPRQIELITQRYSTFDGLTWVQPNGIKSETNVYFTSPQPQRATAALPNANQILTRLPAATYMAGSSRNFKQQWRELLELYEGDKQIEESLTLLRKELTKATGLDLEKDVIDWMDGEYALFFYPTQEGLFNYLDRKINLGIGLVIQTSDRARAESTLKKIDAFIKTTTNSSIAVANRTLKGQPVTSWEAKDGKRLLSIVSHSWIDADTLLITTGLGATKDLTPKPYLPLHLNPTFQTATVDLVKPNDGFTYINMGSTLSFIYGVVRTWMPPGSPYVEETQRLLGSIRSLSTTSTNTPEKIQAESLWVLGTYTKDPNAPDTPSVPMP
jgi:Protein of unknown function (DUF3352)